MAISRETLRLPKAIAIDFEISGPPDARTYAGRAAICAPTGTLTNGRSVGVLRPFSFLRMLTIAVATPIGPGPHLAPPLSQPPHLLADSLNILLTEFVE